MKKLLIVYHSQSGATARLAIAAREGAQREEGVQVQLVRAWDAGIDELIVPDFNLGTGDTKLEALDRILACAGPAARVDRP